MAFLLIFPVLLLAAIARYNCEPVSGYKYANGNGPSQFGDLLKPPPLPLPIDPVPFHGGKPQRHIKDFGYQYQKTSHPVVSTFSPSSDFKFPAPFYKQYNFNFVPPPQPFTTTPSPSFFQKISGWLFPSQQTATDVDNIGIEPFKKDCNPCNLVPWVPVIKYNLGDKNAQENPTYGPPSPTSLAQNIIQYRPQPFNFQGIQEQKSKLLISKPHISYGIPVESHLSGNPSSTYGPPIGPQQISISSQNPSNSIHSLPSSSYGFPKTSTSSSFQQLSLSNDLRNAYGVTSTTHHPISYASTAVPYEFSQVKTNFPANLENNFPGVLQNQPPIASNLDMLNVLKPPGNIQLPKVSNYKGFKNSYGEDISNSNALDLPNSFTSLEAASSKIKTQVVTNNIVKSFEPNVSISLSNPAPFTLNKGRNIHTLQPVALPNLSVAPLPPIFNARPFRPVMSTTFPTNVMYGINHMKKTSENINVAQSIPVAEFVHSIEYPTTIIQSPLIEIDATKSSNQNKTYRNIPNSYVIDEVRDITPQASEDHISSAKVNQDVSFEITGDDIANNLYESSLPTEMRQNSYIPTNHRQVFADLRGVKDEDLDRYRTESNLQNIDSPLLYLKPSAPHKNFENFVLTASTPTVITTTQNEYEIYDEIFTTQATYLSTTRHGDDTRQNNHKDLSTSPDGRENKAKIVQIIVPYITEQSHKGNNKGMPFVSEKAQAFVTKEEHLGRKAPSNTEIPYINTATETSTLPTTTTENLSTMTEEHDSETKNTPTVLNDFYDVKEPPFDIIKLQHTIDDWTEQEYSNHYSTPDRTRSNEKYAKQIPDEFFTTVNPHQDYKTTEYNYEDYDHEGSSSVQHSVTETRNNTSSKTIKEYNVIDTTRSKQLTEKGEDPDENQKPRIYTAASSFRSTTTTPAPWGLIQTSISPLTKEKVYVVTSKPWSEKTETKPVDHGVERFESKKVLSNNYEDMMEDDFPFKSPRFLNRPSFGFTGSGPISLDSIKSDSSYGFSKGWYQSINNLRSLYEIDSTHSSEGPDDRV